MTREESIKFLALIKVAYPSAYKDMDRESKLATVNMWHATFPEIPYTIMEFAFDYFRRVSKFPPTVAEMYEELRRLYYRAVMDDLIASQDGDIETQRRCQWIMRYTSQFRGETLSLRINYGNISEKDLKLLPEGSGQKKLTEGNR